MNRPTRNTLILALSLISWTSWADSIRSQGSEDTSRHSGQTDSRRSTGTAAVPAISPLRPYGSISPRPYDRLPRYGYWSRKCIRQRSSSLGSLAHTRDCDNPAYSGGYYPYGPPYGQGAPVIIINNYDRLRHR